MLRFERGNAKIGGSGLGLSIIKAIADRTDMTVTVISPGRTNVTASRLR